MYNLLLSLFLLLQTLNSHAASVPNQLMGTISATHQFNEKLDVGAFASAGRSQDGGMTYFYYAGPGWQATSGWWTSLRGGAVYNFPTPRDSAPLISWWNFLISDNEHFTVFSEADVIFLDKRQWTHYGFVMGTYQPTVLGAGVHLEEFGGVVTGGPHLKLILGEHVSTNLQFHHGFHGGSNPFLRTVLMHTF